MYKRQGLIITLTGTDRLSVGLDGRTGIALSLMGAICMAAILLLSERILEKQPAKIMMLYMLLSTTAVVGCVSLFFAELTWPTSFPGWLGLCGSSVLYVIATLFLFKAVDLVGSLQTAIIDNTSPIWAIILGVIVLEQWLSAQQLIGASVTVAAVMLLQWITRPKTQNDSI